MYTGLHVKYPLFFSDFNFLDRFSKSNQIKKNHEKSIQWGPSHSMRTDGQTDTTNVTVVFRNVANASKNESGSQDCFQDCGEKKIAHRQTSHVNK
jgi:hypothetical protein